MRRRSISSLRRFVERFLALLLVAAVIALLVGSPASHGQDDTPLDVPFGPVLVMIAAEGDAPPNVPPTMVVHARLEEPDGVYWIASGAIDDPALLVAAGMTVTVLDAETSAAIYYLVDATAPGAVETAVGASRVLWQGAAHLLVATDAEHELALVETLPPRGISLSLLSPLSLFVDETPVQAATVLHADTAPDPAVEALLEQVTAGELQTLVEQISGAAPAPIGGAAVTINTRYTFASRLRDAEQFVYEYYQRLGLDVRYAQWTYGRYSGRNVVAEVRGTTQPQRVLLVGGHLDSTSNLPYSNAPGADDNATGTAATLVLARLLAAYPPSLTVRFIHFTGEEQGQWGSKVYAASLRQAGEQIAGFINLDMIGWDGNGDRVVEIHTARGPKSNALADQYLERNDRYGVGLVFERKTTTASRFSDHSPFWDNDYASFLIIENFFDDARPRDRNPYYHNTGDLATRVDYDYVARIARVTLASLAELAGYTFGDSPATPTPTATPSPTSTLTATLTAMPTATPTDMPGACTELLLNGDFEVSGGWQFGSTPFAARYTNALAYSGARSVQLGIPAGNTNRRAYSTAFQRVTIPADAETPVLLRYVERTSGVADNADYREALLLNSNYGYVARLTRTYAAGSELWHEQVFDLSAYRGRTLVIYFNIYNDGYGSQLWGYLDRVELGNCVHINSPEPPDATETPASTAPMTPTETIAPAPTLMLTATVEPTATATDTPSPTAPPIESPTPVETPEATTTVEVTATPAEAEPTAEATATFIPTEPPSPILHITPDEVHLGALFASDSVTISVQLDNRRSGFAWDATTDASWLQLTPVSDESQEALLVSVAAPDMLDGVYTATVQISVVSVSTQITAEAPVTYVRGVVHSLYLPVVNSAAPE